ncbi:hypothetical protein N9M66_06000 [Litoreibacter sp.]|nr:hypothetical protein [Litoreibacter sp.]
MATQFGSNLQAALEKQDAEQLALLRVTHENALLNLDIGSKADFLKTAQHGLASLQKNLAASQDRKNYYQTLLNTGLTPKEVLQMKLESDAMLSNAEAQGIKGVAIAGYLAPTVFGFSDGDFGPGDAINQGASIAEGVGQLMTQQGQLAVTKAQYDRRDEEWEFQLQQTTVDEAALNEQIKTAELNVQIAQASIDRLNKTITQNAEIEVFFKSRFSTKDLYQWMVSRLSGLHFQTYQIAYAIAASAEQAWQLERADDTAFVNPAVWDDLHKGLLAGESLLLDIQRMDQAYFEQNKRRFEITKIVSLCDRMDTAADKKHDADIHGDQSNTLPSELKDTPVSTLPGKDDDTPKPSAFEKAKENLPLKFKFSEAEFDKDYPDHAGKTRQIQSVSITLPALLGPYQSVHATLRQTTNQYAKNGNMIRGRQDEAVTLSHGINDTGVFESSSTDSRYLPFEGTGVDSEWELDITGPNKDELIENLSDVIVELRYTVLR